MCQQKKNIRVLPIPILVSEMALMLLKILESVTLLEKCTRLFINLIPDLSETGTCYFPVVSHTPVMHISGFIFQA